MSIALKKYSFGAISMDLIRRSKTTRLARSSSRQSCQTLQPTDEIGIADSSFLVQDADGIEYRLRDHSRHDAHELLVPQSVVDELLRYGRGVQESDSFRRLMKLEKQKVAKRVDVKRLAERDETLDTELTLILPTLASLTSKSVLDQQVRQVGDEAYKLIARITARAQPVRPLRGRIEDIRETIKKTAGIITSVFIDYAENPSNSKWKAYRTRVITHECLKNICDLADQFQEAYASWFWTNAQEVDKFLPGYRFDIDKLQQEKPDRMSGYDKLEEAYKKSLSKVVHRLVYEALWHRSRSQTGRAKINIRDLVKREYGRRFGPTSQADIEVASAYAWPFEEIDQGLAERLKHGGRIILLTNDKDIEQMIELRRDYLVKKSS